MVGIIRNPSTGKMVRIGGPTYAKIVKKYPNKFPSIEIIREGSKSISKWKKQVRKSKRTRRGSSKTRKMPSKKRVNRRKRSSVRKTKSKSTRRNRRN